MWNVVNLERGKKITRNVDFTDIIKNNDGSIFPTKKASVDALNFKFLQAAAAASAPRADVARALAKLCAARAPADRSLRIRPFTADEVHRLITSRIPPKASQDIYGLSMKLFRAAADAIAPVLSDLFNMCIQEGTFPEALKSAKISPIFKGKGRKEDMDCYRPVSIIPAVAKIFENGLSLRLTSFLSETQQLSDRQHAYRAGRSTTTLTRDLVRRIVGAREGKQHVAVICCDLSKAFDVADHDVLSAKLEYYGLGDKALALATSILRDRSQVVVGDGGRVRSEPLRSSMGVAQGSSVSNILFSLLLNDLPDAITSAEILMYADDVAAIVTAPTLDELEALLNVTGSQLHCWFRCNGLALNLKKTHYSHFNISGRKYRRLQVFVDSVEIEQTNVMNFLGFEIDSVLTWEYHINKLCGKIASACYALRRVARVVPAGAARACYFATVHSLLQHGAELFGSAADWERAFRMQKRAVRAVAGISSDKSAAPHFQKLGIMTLPCIVIFQVAMYVRNNLQLYSVHGDLHTRRTRRAGQLKEIPRALAKSDKLTHVMGPTVYNKLPNCVTTAPSLPCFKSRLRRWLVDRTFYSLTEFYNYKECTVVQ